MFPDLQAIVRQIFINNQMDLPDASTPFVIEPMTEWDVALYKPEEKLTRYGIFSASKGKPSTYQSMESTSNTDVVRIYTNITAVHTIVPDVAAGILQTELLRFERFSTITWGVDKNNVLGEIPLNLLLSNDKAFTGATVANVNKVFMGYNALLPIVFRENQKPNWNFNPVGDLVVPTYSSGVTPVLPGLDLTIYPNAAVHYVAFQFHGIKVRPTR